MQVRVKRITYEAESINSYELVPLAGGELDPFTAGSHIDLHLPNGMIRSYSLVNDQSERNRYVIAVNKDAASRGGSSFVHETLRAGTSSRSRIPGTILRLQEDAGHSVLIAGGIGITPLLSMIRRLEALGRSWELFYAARTRVAAAFLDELNAFDPAFSSNLHVNFDQEPSGRMFDLAAIVRDTRRQMRISIAAAPCRCSRRSRPRRPIGRPNTCTSNISRPGRSRRPRAASR